MEIEVNFPAIVLHRTARILFSLRGVIALGMALFMILMGSYFVDEMMSAGSVTGELYALFKANPGMKFQWFFFDGAVSKLVTMFMAPILIFDAVSGDRTHEKIGILLSRPITRFQYIQLKLVSATLALGILFFGTMIPGYLLIHPHVPKLTVSAYLATCILMFLLGFFALCVSLLISTISKNNLISFITAFGLFSFLMMPNAMKYTSDGMMNLAKATPHYYSTYFTTHSFEAGFYAFSVVIIVLCSLIFFELTIIKFRDEDL